MSTNSFIAMKNPDDSISFIYCHSDGYLRFVGQLLKEKYMEEETVKQLINLGDLSYLGDVPESNPETWDYTLPQKEGHIMKTNYATTYYCRSYAARGEDLQISSRPSLNSFIDYLKEDGQSFNYLFIDGEWLLFNWSTNCFEPFDVPEKEEDY